MPDVFVSYARSTLKEAQRVAEALRGLGYDVWWDDNLPGRRAYGEVIEERLKAARAVIVVWSAEAVKSHWVRSEADRARVDDKLIQARIDRTPLPMPFDQIQSFNLSGWSGDPDAHEWRKVLESLEEIVGSRPAPTRAGRDGGPRRSWRSLRLPAKWRIPGAALAAGLVAIGVWVATGLPGLAKVGDGVAVMPFETAPGDPVARNLADRVTDQVESTLATTDLKALPADAGAGLLGQQRDAAAVRLGAALALGGRVARDGSALNVSVVIDDAQRRQILWSDDFNRPAAQAQGLQEQVATKVAYVLQCALRAHGSPSSGRIGAGSLGLYLRACDLFAGGDTARVRDLFREVVTREPRFADAWANFALSSALAASELPPDQGAAARRDARDAAQRALQLDPKSGEAYVALATLDPGPAHLWERQTLLLKGLAAAPDNARLNYRESELLGQAGRFDEMLAYGSRAAGLDPLQPFLTGFYASELAAAGRMTEARALMERAARTWPDVDDIKGGRIGIELRHGDPARALALLADPAALPSRWEASWVDDLRRYVLVRQSRDPMKVAAYVSDVLRRQAAGALDVGETVRRLAGLGATDAVFVAAARSSAADPLDIEVLFRPFADPIRRDPRFMPLAARLGLVDFWRRTGKWPDFCEAPDRPYDCRAEAAKLAQTQSPTLPSRDAGGGDARLALRTR